MKKEKMDTGYWFMQWIRPVLAATLLAMTVTLLIKGFAPQLDLFAQIVYFVVLPFSAGNLLTVWFIDMVQRRGGKR